ncbi:hypothetical protein SAMN05216243_0798 [Sediminibacillus albus]|uniref:Uncharacterized protein n=1 Tax=Sediminibacillus albus TaxID=407036 RepID=A0A1G8WIQ3_9BACI|nr:hypothetical protein SAMN05216243_0798 [Sediminibacillus albus]
MFVNIIAKFCKLIHQRFFVKIPPSDSIKTIHLQKGTELVSVPPFSEDNSLHIKVKGGC